MSSLNQKIAQLKKLTIRQAEVSDDSRLFVMNTSKPQKGNINVTVTGHGGEKHTIQVPATYIPVDLSNQMEKTLILRNPNFRRIHAAGHIALVDPNDAEQFLLRPEVQREYQKIYGVHAVVDTSTTIGIQPENNLQGSMDTLEDRALAEGIDPFIVNMLMRSNAESGETAADLITELDSRLADLDVTSVRFLADNTTNQAIKDWAVESVQLIEN